MMKRHVYILLALIAMIFARESTVFACSGGPPPWNEWLPRLVESNDAIVVGRYVELDDTDANGILQVDTYLQGSGAEFILIHASDLRAIENERIGRFRYQCGAFSPHNLRLTGEYVYFLRHQTDGSYQISHYRYFADSTSTTIMSYDNESGDYLEATMDEFILSITEALDDAPTAPLPDSIYPRYAPILLTTSDERYFLLPIDDDELVEVSSDELFDLRRDQFECSAPPCTVYSPNGADKIYLRPSEEDLYPTEWLLPYVESNAVGDRIIVSATSDTYALWQGRQIQIYALWYPAYGYPDDWLERSYTAELINEITADASLDYPVAWKPNGRELIFSTNEGLWSWDALTIDSEPQLLISATDNVPVVRHVSPQGRYIAVTHGDQHFNFDTLSYEILPDGHVSPDDRILLAFDTQADTNATLDVIYLAPGIRLFEYDANVNFLNVEWIDNTYFIASIMGSSYLDCEVSEAYEDPVTGERLQECNIFVVEDTFYDVNLYHSSGIHTMQNDLKPPYFLNGVQVDKFTYKPVLGTIESSVDGYHIVVNRKPISFQLQLSSPIIDIEWLSPLFYFDS